VRAPRDLDFRETNGRNEIHMTIYLNSHRASLQPKGCWQIALDANYRD
jgi:hypothetical protein